MAAAGWRMRCTFAKETSVIGKFVQSFQAPLCKGSSAEGGEGLFFTTRLGDACKHAPHTCKSLPPLRGPPPLTQGRLFISVRGPPEPVSATLASVLRILANPSLAREG